MNFEQALDLIRQKDKRGELHNLVDDFVFSYRDEPDHGTRYGSALLRLKRLSRGHQVAVDEIMIETSDAFSKWVEERKAIR